MISPLEAGWKCTIEVFAVGSKVGDKRPRSEPAQLVVPLRQYANDSKEVPGEASDVEVDMAGRPLVERFPFEEPLVNVVSMDHTCLIQDLRLEALYFDAGSLHALIKWNMLPGMRAPSRISSSPP